MIPIIINNVHLDCVKAFTLVQMHVIYDNWYEFLDRLELGAFDQLPPSRHLVKTGQLNKELIARKGGLSGFFSKSSNLDQDFGDFIKSFL